MVAPAIQNTNSARCQSGTGRGKMTQAAASRWNIRRSSGGSGCMSSIYPTMNITDAPVAM